MKIAFFDYWTRGHANFLPIKEELSKRGHSVLLLHIGSFRSPHPATEINHGIETRDISFYKTKFIFNMLKAERPDVILSLNTTYIFDRAMVLAARELGIKTVYLMHGNRAWQEQSAARIDLARDSYNPLPRRLAKAWKYLVDVIPNYFYSYFHYSNRQGWQKPFRVMLRYFIDPGLCFHFPPYADEIVHDKCLVYANSDVDHFCKMGYQRRQVAVTGNPKMDGLHRRLQQNDFSVQKLPKAVAQLVASKQDYVVLIEDSFPETRNGWTNEDRNQYLDQVATTLATGGLRLVVKVHPSSNLESIQVRDPQVLVYQNEALDDLLYHCKYCVTHYSTAVNQAVVLNKAVVQPRWGKSAKIIDYYIHRKVASAWNDPLQLPRPQGPSASLEAYKEEYISVVKPEAVSNIVTQILQWEDQKLCSTEPERLSGS